MRYKISVIIPCYNAETTIEACLNSILSQSYQNFEIIVINDLSCDNSSQILQKFSKNIILITNDNNIGPSLSRNIGVSKSSGDVFVFLDADCYLGNNNSFESIIEYIKEGEDVLVGVQDSTPFNDDLFAYYWAFYRNFLWEKSDWKYTSAWSLNRGVITKAVWDKVGCFNTEYKGADVEDLEYGYRMEDLGYRVRISRNFKIVNSFPTFYESLRKIPKRTYLWLSLVKKRKKTDNISTSGSSIIKSFISLFLIISLFFNLYFTMLMAVVYLIVSYKFIKECYAIRPKNYLIYPLIDIFVHLLPFGMIYYYLKQGLYENTFISKKHI